MTSSTSPQPIFAFNKEEMGHGSLELGQLLLKGLINLLPETIAQPPTILFYNAGVKLACQGSPVIASLKKLEEQGATILLCGTCLDFFQLKDKIEVGTISNMREILGHLASGAPIIAP